MKISIQDLKKINTYDYTPFSRKGNELHYLNAGWGHLEIRVPNRNLANGKVKPKGERIHYQDCNFNLDGSHV